MPCLLCNRKERGGTGVPTSCGSNVDLSSVSPTGAEHGVDTDHSRGSQSHVPLRMPGYIFIEIKQQAAILLWLYMVF